MGQFSNILVGVDLSKGDWLASASGDTPSHFACEQAVALAAAAKKAGHQQPKVHFVAALDLDERTKRLIAESPADEQTVVRLAEQAIKLQVAEASKQGVVASYSVELGPPATVLVQLAGSEAHDLVILGTRKMGLISGMLMGSTAISLLANRKAPVWVVKPSDTDRPRRLLVATDFSPMCQQLLEYGINLAKLFNADLHVTHVAEDAKRPYLQFSQVDEAAVQRSHQKVLDTAREKLDAIAASEAASQLSKPLATHLREGVPSQVIVEQTNELEIDLLLIGAVAWGGVPGLVMGSTARQMLTSLDCSLLTLHALD